MFLLKKMYNSTFFSFDFWLFASCSVTCLSLHKCLISEIKTLSLTGSLNQRDSFLQVYQDTVSGHHVASAEGAPTALVLGHDVRICRRQHAATLGDFPGVGPAAGPAALHHDRSRRTGPRRCNVGELLY